MQSIFIKNELLKMKINHPKILEISFLMTTKIIFKGLIFIIPIAFI